MEERFDLDFHILTPGGRDEHILSTVAGKVVVVPPPAREKEKPPEMTAFCQPVR